jgi:hypothetical protein
MRQLFLAGLLTLASLPAFAESATAYFAGGCF